MLSNIRFLSRPNAMHGKFGLLSQGKASSHSTVATHVVFAFCCFLSCVSGSAFVFPYHLMRPAHLRQMDMGSLTCAQTWVRAVAYTQKGVRHKQVCTRVDSEGQEKLFRVTLPHQGIEPRVFAFELRLSSNH